MRVRTNYFGLRLDPSSREEDNSTHFQQEERALHQAITVLVLHLEQHVQIREMQAKVLKVLLETAPLRLKFLYFSNI